MKKILFGLALAFISATTYAQTVVRDAGTLSKDDFIVNLGGVGSSDTAGYGNSVAPVQATLTGPDTATYYVKILGSRKNLTWNMIIDDTGSGTLSGTVTIKACTNYIGNRSNWWTLSFLTWKTIHSDTIVDGDQVFSYADTSNAYQYYQVQFINSASTTICKVMAQVTGRN